MSEHQAENDCTLTDAERRALAHTFHGAQWLSPERAECVERIIAARLAPVKALIAASEHRAATSPSRTFDGGTFGAWVDANALREAINPSGLTTAAPTPDPAASES